jgi:DNA-directed RNA polymerase subunit RPC12/RpoP
MTSTQEWQPTSQKKHKVCRVCGVKFEKENQLRKHRRDVHMTEDYSCIICGKCFKEKRALRRHSISHTDERPFECHHCGSRFKSDNKFRSHLKLHEDTDVTYTCQICGKVYNHMGKPAYLMHVQRHHNNPRITCDVCGKIAAGQCKFSKHMLGHEIKYPCHVCDKVFHIKKKYKRHLKRHNSKSPETYLCNVCGKSLRLVASLIT